MIHTDLYIAVGDDRTSLPNAEWDSFIDEVVVPRFPRGFSVMPGDGLWHNMTLRRTQRLQLRVLVIFHDDSQDDRRKVEEVVSEWKKRYPCESVMRVERIVDVTF